MSSASITIQRKNRPGMTTFAIPMVVVWLVIIPLSLLCAPFILVFCVLDGMDPFDFYSALWRIICALDGSEFEHEDSRRSVSVRIVQQQL